MTRTMNFNAGPSCMPLPVLEEARAEFLDFNGTGMSILEVSHRSPEYDAVHKETSANLLKLLGLGDDYAVLFMTGGASTQFALLPMNFLGEGQTADYVNTGTWSKKAIKEASSIGTVNVAGTGLEGEKFVRCPSDDQCNFTPGAAYVHITSNNTIAGTQYHTFPQVDAPLVADMSSDILWRPTDASKFHMIYAGAQKNLGPSGVTIVVIKRSWVEEKAADGLLTMFSYKTYLDKDSLMNTAPVFPIYMVGKTLKWIEGRGGLESVYAENKQKAELIYSTMDDNPDFFSSPVEKQSRSYMNVVFRMPTEELEKQFIEQGKLRNMGGIKGHRSVGGIRFSIYNAVPLDWVQQVAEFMKEFAAKNG